VLILAVGVSLALLIFVFGTRTHRPYRVSMWNSEGSVSRLLLQFGRTSMGTVVFAGHADTPSNAPCRQPGFMQEIARCLMCSHFVLIDVLSATAIASTWKKIEGNVTLQ
jgi:hypothetical protein